MAIIPSSLLAFNDRPPKARYRQLDFKYIKGTIMHTITHSEIKMKCSTVYQSKSSCMHDYSIEVGMCAMRNIQVHVGMLEGREETLKYVGT